MVREGVPVYCGTPLNRTLMKSESSLYRAFFSAPKSLSYTFSIFNLSKPESLTSGNRPLFSVRYHLLTKKLTSLNQTGRESFKFFNCNHAAVKSQSEVRNAHRLITHCSMGPEAKNLNSTVVPLLLDWTNDHNRGQVNRLSCCGWNHLRKHMI